MGDSGGVYEGYQQSEPDIRAAVDALIAARPEVDEVILESESAVEYFSMPTRTRA
jgi:hypothetical protein